MNTINIGVVVIAVVGTRYVQYNNPSSNSDPWRQTIMRSRK